MKQIIKGAVLGGIIGIAAPIALSVINEFEGSQRSGGTKQARICFANRLWNLETFEIKHAPGCKNGILESTPTILLISVLSGSLIGALSLIKSNTQAGERESKTPSITPIESPNKDPLPSQEIVNVPLREAKTPSPTTFQKPLSKKPLGYLLAILGGSLGAPLGWITSPIVLVILNNVMKEKDGKQPNRFLVWSLIGIVGAPLSLAPIIILGSIVNETSAENNLQDARDTYPPKLSPSQIKEMKRMADQIPVKTTPLWKLKNY